jgi:drug/metabolite transporter (DMT)-like permease
MRNNGSLRNQSNESPRFPPPIGLLLGVFAASTASILIRFAQTDAPSLVIATYRLSLATIILLPVLLGRHRSDLKRLKANDLLLMFLSGGFLALHFATWITSLEYTSVASSIVLVQTSPLFVALFSPLLLRETPTRITIVGMSIALIGSLIVGMSDACSWHAGFECRSVFDLSTASAVKGDLLALGGAVAAAGYLIIGRRVRKRVKLIPYVSITYGTAAVVLALLMLGARQSPLGYSSQTYIWFFLLALFPQLLAHSTYNWLLRYLPAALVSIAWLGEPIGSTILAYFILTEIPTFPRLVGGIIILCGIAVAVWRPGRASTTIPADNIE